MADDDRDAASGPGTPGAHGRGSPGARGRSAAEARDALPGRARTVRLLLVTVACLAASTVVLVAVLVAA